MLGNGNGTFGAAASIPAGVSLSSSRPGTSTWGRPWILPWSTGGIDGISILPATGTAPLAANSSPPPTTFGGLPSATSTTDGDIDIAATNLNDSRIVVLLGMGRAASRDRRT